MPNVFTLLKNDDAAKYLPELTRSIAIKCANTNLSKDTGDSINGNWKRMSRFEGSLYESTLLKSDNCINCAVEKYLKR